MAESEYVHVGEHAENLESGALIGPGEHVPADALGDGDRWLIEDGVLRDVDSFGGETVVAGDALQQRARDLQIQGRSTMSADELRDAVAAREAEIASDPAEGGEG
jgi:hypothetical protein